MNPSPSIVHVDIVDTVIELQRWQHHLDDHDVGAHAWFLGVTRRTTGDRTTVTLHYQAQRSMALKEMRRLCEVAVNRFCLSRVVLVHRLNEVPVGEASVLVGCCSPHRKSVFDALPWIMDELKRNVPIWKREVFADGETQWVHPGESPANESSGDG